MRKLAACVLTILIPVWVVSSSREAVPDKAAGVGEIRAAAYLQPRSGSKVHGVIHFVQRGDTVTITGEVTGLTPGEHGFHIHEYGDCSDDKALNAGAHYNPASKKHGGPHDEERHAGDLGNITADAQGVARIQLTDKVIRLSGPHSIVGRSVVVHEKRDDLKSQPAGDAGARVACGIIGLVK